jgi:hypothetical protein
MLLRLCFVAPQRGNDAIFSEMDSGRRGLCRLAAAAFSQPSWVYADILWAISLTPCEGSEKVSPGSLAADFSRG